MEYRCFICNKQFQSAEALEQHRKAAHSGHVPQKTTRKKKYISGIILIAFLLLLGYAAARFISPVSAEEKAFAQCIADSGAQFYGAFWCPHCQDQKKIFGKAARYLPYIECSNSDRSQKQICVDAGINAYPTWVFTDGTQGNVMTKLELSRRTGCALPA